MTGTNEQDRIVQLQLRYVLIDGLLAGMGERQLQELAADGGITVQPGTGEHELRQAIRARNAARAREYGVPIDNLPTLTAQQAHDLARQLSSEPAPPDEPE
jgi:hypothetical protein